MSAPTDTTRALLVEVRRWARANRWWLGWSGWHSADGSTVVDWTDDRDEITVRRGGATLGLDYPVASVREAVDILCVLGVLPARFSSAHRTAQADLDRVTRERDSLARRCALRYEETEKLRAEVAQWEATYGKGAHLPGALNPLKRARRERNAARAEVERLADDRENIHARLLNALEQTGWIEPEQRHRFDPLAAAAFAADALTQSANAKQAVMQVANDTNARLRTLLLSALGVEDDDRTGPDEYIRRLVAQRDQAVRDRDGARDALRRVQERYDEVRAEVERLRPVVDAVRRAADEYEGHRAELPQDVVCCPGCDIASDLSAAVDALDADAPGGGPDAV